MGTYFYDFNDEISCWLSSISRKERKRTIPKCHCILTVYFLEKALLSSAFQKRLFRNENQEIKFSGQHTLEAQMKRFCNDVMLQPQVWDQVFILSCCP